jgi:hypothetical protein
MHLSLILALQAAAAPPPPAPRWAMPSLIAREPARFDLARAPAAGSGGCGGRGEADVLVCGARRRDGAYPMAYWARLFAPAPIRAEMDLGGNVQGRVHAEAVPMDRGAVSNRVMVGIRWPF